MDRFPYYPTLVAFVLQLYGCITRHIGHLSTGFRAILPERTIDQFTSISLHPPSALDFRVIDAFFAFRLNGLLSGHDALLVVM
jgi:hypothetical protein